MIERKFLRQLRTAQHEHNKNLLSSVSLLMDIKAYELLLWIS